MINFEVIIIIDMLVIVVVIIIEEKGLVIALPVVVANIAVGDRGM